MKLPRGEKAIWLLFCILIWFCLLLSLFMICSIIFTTITNIFIKIIVGIVMGTVLLSMIVLGIQSLRSEDK